MNFKPAFLIALMATFAWRGYSATITASGGGDWYSTTPNNPWPGGTVPQSTDDAVITSSVLVQSDSATIHNLTITGGGTFYNNDALTVTGELTLTNTVSVQQGANITIDGNLNLCPGTTYDPSVASISVSGTTFVGGTLKDGAGGIGQDNFNNVTVSPGGAWTLTDVTDWDLTGNLTNNGSITSSVGSGGITFTGGNNTISGANAFSISEITVNGTYVNDAALTISKSLSGTGSLDAGVNSSLTLGGTITVVSFDATNAPNTVTYNQPGAQTVFPASYYNLVLAGSNTKTMAGTINVANNLTVSSTAQASVNGTVNVSGSTTVNPGAYLVGTGALTGSVVIFGTLSPGVPLGTLTLDSPPVLFGTILMEINRASSPNADELAISGGQALSYGGALTVANLGATLVAGDTFQLFNANGYNGSFAPVNLPSLGTNLMWTNLLQSNGTIAVVSTVTNSSLTTNSPSILESYTNDTLTLSWDTNDYPGFNLQCTTNLACPWSDETNGSVSPVFITVNPVVPSMFFRLFHP